MHIEQLYSQGNFPTQWREKGIISESLAEAVLLIGRQSEDPYPEHYRWRTFTRLAQAAREQSEMQMLHTLYNLAEAEEDRALATSMRLFIIDLPECPHQILVEAMHSSSQVVQKKARSRCSN